MARLPRIAPPNIPQHIIQRSNHRQPCFVTEQDYLAYLAWLTQYARQYQVEVHAWVLMSNHVHLLCTSRMENGISKMMQSLGRCYVRYFNQCHQRSGTLWQGRYKSCLVQQDDYLLQVYRYIELNPVRAGLVEQAADYPWSSYSINALGQQTTLGTPHPCYLALAGDATQRKIDYQAWLNQGISQSQLNNIRHSLNTGIILGDPYFNDYIAALTQQRLPTGKRGRPIGSRKPKTNPVI